MDHTYKQTDRQIFAAIFLIGFTCLMYELIQVRMLSFFLGGISNFLAIPLALFGLALGSLYCHFFYKGDQNKLIANFTAAVFPVTTAVFIIFFLVANTFFSNIHVSVQDPWRDSVKLISYSIIFLSPYFIFGALLASFFENGADKIGKLYFFDLVGAGLGCLVTPLLFTYTDLTPVIMILLFASLVLSMTSRVRRKTVLFVMMVLTFGVVQALSANGTILKERPNAVMLARTLLRANPKQGGREEVVRWNSLARTSLLRARIKSPTAENSRFTITQDDGISNVHVRKYEPNATRAQGMERMLHHAFPILLNHQPKNVLVMFAGVARDMVMIDQLAEHKAKITGVELNDAVVDLTYNPVLFPMNLHNFLGRDGIDLVAAEGRDFLNTSDEKYDLIFLATNGSIHASRTGHSRKYLDTYEAMRAYLDHLTDDGLMVFSNQPVQSKIPSFRKLFEERGMPDFRKAVHVMGHPSRPETDSMILKPQGLSRQDVARAEAKARKLDRNMRRLYTPFHEGYNRITHVVTAPLDEIEFITDDQPFIRKVEYSDFTLLPSKKQLKDQVYASSWIKIFTILLFAAVSLLVILAARFKGGAAGRVPFPWLMYFLVSGISYMCVEIGLIAKTELFLGNPLYAVAIILAFFLAFNGLGAYLQDKYGVMRGAKTMVAVTAASVAWGLVAAQLCNDHLLSINIVAKILAVAIAVFPVGTALGMYYPFGVGNLVESGKRSTVPMTYCIATLSSVLGSSWAMTGITNTGFSTMIIIGGVGYASVAFIYLVARKLTKVAA